MIFKTISSKSTSLQMRSEKSRRDVILLTVEFILRTLSAVYSLQVPQGRPFGEMFVSSLRDFGAGLFRLPRRLKPTVNQVLSLRDSSPLNQYYGNLFIFCP